MADETEKIILALSKRLTAEVAEYRFTHRLASRSDAFRRLIRLGLATAKHGQPEPVPDA